MIVSKFETVFSEALQQYQSLLETTGYASVTSMRDLLITDFLYELLTSYRNCITEDDYKDISRLLYCLIGKNCLLDYPDFKKQTIIFKYTPGTINKPKDDEYSDQELEFDFDILDIFHRLTEDYYWRFTEDGKCRDKEDGSGKSTGKDSGTADKEDKGNEGITPTPTPDPTPKDDPAKGDSKKEPDPVVNPNPVPTPSTEDDNKNKDKEDDMPTPKTDESKNKGDAAIKVDDQLHASLEYTGIIDTNKLRYDPLTGNLYLDD